jgi:Methyltransferase domain
VTTYENIEKLAMPLDLQSWPSAGSPLFQELIDQLQPLSIIEVGSWKGVSAIRMAEISRRYGTHVHCIDTWLGSFEHFVSGDKLPRDEWGYPKLFHQFLANVKASGMQEHITPYPMCSNDGARYLKRLGVTAKLIYVDGDHSHEGCYNDCVHYWPLVEDGGVMFGDDFDVFEGVKSAVIRFVMERDLKCIQHGGFWLIRK